MARTTFFNPVKATKRDCKIQLNPSDDENDCGSMYEQLPLCVGARVICRRNIDFDGAMVNGTEATVKNIVWENTRHILISVPNKCVFPDIGNVVTTTLPNYVELGT